MKTRMNIYLEPELKRLIYVKAKQLGLQPGVLATLAIKAGIEAVSMATDPDWKKFFEIMTKEEK